MPWFGAAGRPPPVVGRSECPPYYVTFVGGDHVLVAGGGGAAKTGVSNRLCVYLVQLPCGGESAGRIELTPVRTVDTSPRPTMNAHLLRRADGTALLAAGQDDTCALYRLAPSLHWPSAEPKSAADGGGERHRVQPLLCIEATSAGRFRTDFHPAAAYQKCVAAAADQGADSPTLLATGGADGCLRLWRAGEDSGGEMLAQADGAHEGDVDSVSLSPCGTVLLSVGSGDHRVALWTVSADEGGSAAGLRLRHAADSPTPMRIDQADAKCRPRFALFTRLGVRNLVYVVSYIAVHRVAKGGCSQLALCVYDQRRKVTVTIRHAVATDEVISCMCVSSSGSRTAVGTLQGSVAVFDTHTLSKLYEAHGTHSIFVTGVALAPDHCGDDNAACHGASLSLHSRHAAVCVSVSADQTVQMHCAPCATGRSYTASLCIMFMLMLFAYWTLKLIGV